MTISGQNGSRIKIVFEDFRLESSTDCANDYIEIKDNSGGIVLNRVCGDINNLANMTVIDVSVDKAPLSIEFKTDDSDTDKGFKISWYIGEEGGSEEAITKTTTITTEENDKFCGGTLTEMDCCGADLDRQCGYGQGDCDANEQCAGDLK